MRNPSARPTSSTPREPRGEDHAIRPRLCALGRRQRRESHLPRSGEDQFSRQAGDGTLFDSSQLRGEPSLLRLASVMPCLSEGLRLMRVGGRSRVVCLRLWPMATEVAAERAPGATVTTRSSCWRSSAPLQSRARSRRRVRRPPRPVPTPRLRAWWNRWTGSIDPAIRNSRRRPRCRAVSFVPGSSLRSCSLYSASFWRMPSITGAGARPRTSRRSMAFVVGDVS